MTHCPTVQAIVIAGGDVVLTTKVVGALVICL